MAVALCVMSANAISAVTYDDNNNKGQTVSIGAGLVVAVTMPMIELMIDNSVTIWHVDKSVTTTSAWFR